MAGIIQPFEEVPAPRIPPAALNAAERDLWIFREGKQSLSGPEVTSQLRRSIQDAFKKQDLLDALIGAGELEAALADSPGSPRDDAQKLTDCLAAALLDGDSAMLPHALSILDKLEVPAQINISPPEGFSYYALHPIDFARVVNNIPREPEACAIVGIRSIGTTLSAIVLSQLKREHRPATRITVRPCGHPYARKTEFNRDEMRWIDRNRERQFLVVDEGPGRSGSTFLSVAEALVRAGVSRERITMLGSRPPDLNSLCAENAESRWSGFHFLATTPSVNRRFEGWTYAGGGVWREILIPLGHPWPESWIQMERLKFLSPDRQVLQKFEGMGPIGSKARARAFSLADGRFGPQVLDGADGFMAYEVVQGSPARSSDVTASVLDRMADYCAFRLSEFRAASSQQSQLREMLEYNVKQEFGMELSLQRDAFYTDLPVITDGRMQPHEWIVGDELIKTDGVDHGDNHFFPGPCDITWDLAGLAV